MKVLSLLAALALIASCASGPRKPASVGQCELVKHNQQNWYRLEIKGEPIYPSWYTKDQAEKHYDKYAKLGKCN